MKQEDAINRALPSLTGIMKVYQELKLQEIADHKQRFTFYELECIGEMLKPKANGKKILELTEKQIELKKQKKLAIEQMNKITEKEDAMRKFKLDQQESIFIAWFITSLITNKISFMDDFSAIVLFELLKNMLAPDRPNTSLNI